MTEWKESYRTGEKALTPKEYTKIIAAINTLTDLILIKLAVTTGLRRHDISRIKISNIDFKEGTLLFHEHKKNIDRTIPLNSEVLQTIRMYLDTIPKREYLFPWGKSKWGDKTAYNRFNKLCDIAKIPRRPFHALRATCIKFCKKAGWSEAQVAKLTGDTIRVIQEHYETPSDAEMNEVVKEKPVI